jgi:hypothetical protein
MHSDITPPMTFSRAGEKAGLNLFRIGTDMLRIRTVSILPVLSYQRMSLERKQTPQVIDFPGADRWSK